MQLQLMFDTGNRHTSVTSEQLLHLHCNCLQPYQALWGIINSY